MQGLLKVCQVNFFFNQCFILSLRNTQQQQQQQQLSSRRQVGGSGWSVLFDASSETMDRGHVDWSGVDAVVNASAREIYVKGSGRKEEPRCT